jgi:dsDNA-specific endonuclease/ATPase MutS2
VRIKNQNSIKVRVNQDIHTNKKRWKINNLKFKTNPRNCLQNLNQVHSISAHLELLKKISWLKKALKKNHLKTDSQNTNKGVEVAHSTIGVQVVEIISKNNCPSSEMTEQWNKFQ